MALVNLLGCRFWEPAVPWFSECVTLGEWAEKKALFYMFNGPHPSASVSLLVVVFPL